jgi:hypothetical protein
MNIIVADKLRVKGSANQTAPCDRASKGQFVLIVRCGRAAQPSLVAVGATNWSPRYLGLILQRIILK